MSNEKQENRFFEVFDLYPTDEALTKLIYLATMDISKKWSVALKECTKDLIFPSKSYLLSIFFHSIGVVILKLYSLLMFLYLLIICSILLN